MASVALFGPASENSEAAWIMRMIARSRAEGTVISAEVDLTPALAEELLRRNIGNRPLAQAHAMHLAEVMARGEWCPSATSDSIAVTETGRMIEGQHRCHAIGLSQVTIKALMVFGVADRTFHVIGQSRPRSATDVLAMLGVKGAARASSVIRLLMQLGDNPSDVTSCRKIKITNSQVKTYLEQNEGIAEHVAWGETLRKNYWPIASGVMAALWILLRNGSSPEHVKHFGETLSTGLNLTNQASPIYRLRSLLMNDKNVIYSSLDHAAWTIKAWNAWRSNRPVQLLGWKNGETFPRPMK